MHIQGPCAPAPQLVGASGQLGKEQALSCAEHLFFQCGVGLMRACLTNKYCPLSAELPEYIQEENIGSTETNSEAPEAYAICSCGNATRIVT